MLLVMETDSMSLASDGFTIVDSDEDEDLGLFPIEDVVFSMDTEWFFEGAWYALISVLDDRYPDMSIGEAMGSEDDDGHLGVWGRFDFGQSVMWLRVMTFSPFHWEWKGVEYN
jgi:hypothetical protein